MGAATSTPRTAMKQVCPFFVAEMNANGFAFCNGIALTSVKLADVKPRCTARSFTLSHWPALKTPHVAEGLNVDDDRPLATAKAPLATTASTPMARIVQARRVITEESARSMGATIALTRSRGTSLRA